MTLTYFPFVGGFCPKGREFRLGVLIWEIQGRQRTGFGKTVETDITILEAGGRSDAQVALFPIVAYGNQTLKSASAGVSAGGALERCPMGVISARTSAYRGIQVETVPKDRGISAHLSTIDIDVSPAIEIDAGVGIAAGQANCDVWS